MMSRTKRIALGIFCILIVDALEAENGHEKMVRLLKTLAAESVVSNPILSDQTAVKLRKELEEAGDQAPPEKLFPLLAALGEQELRLGNIETGIERLKQSLALMNKPGGDSIGQENKVLVPYRLGVAYMRLGETQNCQLHHTAESCILPLKGSALHQKREGSRLAIEQFNEVLKLAGKDSAVYLKSKWLMNLAYMTLNTYPDQIPKEYLIPPDLFQSSENYPRFENIAPKLGLDTFNLAGGVIADDFDNDGHPDLFVSTWQPDSPLLFFRNEGDGSFTDRSSAANLSGITGGFNLIQADYNNDGNVDVLVLRGAWLGERGKYPSSLLRNNGNGTFTDVTFEAGLGEIHWPSQTAAWADYDNDGDLDLFKGNEAAWKIKPPCQLFRNNGNGTFTDVASQAGVLNERFTKSVVWGDYDNDRDPDLYISNLGMPNRLYRNNGNGTFTDVAEEMAVSRPIWSFPSWFWDYNNDGNLDLFVASYDWSNGNLAAFVGSALGLSVNSESTRLYRGNGAGGFDEVAGQSGLTRIHLPMGANFGDLDNDGYLDFYLGTGYPDYEGLMPNVMYRNKNGVEFVDITMAGGFGHLQKGHGVAFADLDNDGDLDVFEQMGGFFHGDKARNVLFQNPGFNHHWITVRLIGTKSNRSAIGARIRAEFSDENGNPRKIFRFVNSGATFGANSFRQTIGIGKADKIDKLEIFWPTTGKSQTFSNLSADQFITITEGSSEIKVEPPAKVSSNPR